MNLTNNSLAEKSKWINADINIPLYNREQITENTLNNPAWIHFGAGNIFRAFPAMLQQTLLNKNAENTGIIVVEGYDYEIIEKAYRPFDDLSLLVTLNTDGSTEKTVIGSVVKSLIADYKYEKDIYLLKELFKKPSLQMVSFTITEKGYQLKSPSGDFYNDVYKDLNSGPENPISYIGKISSLCYERFLNGELPVALVSMDNCSHNGTKLFEAINTFAKEWENLNIIKKGFVNYINNNKKVSFPWTMIDKITPRPDSGIKKMIESIGFTDCEIIVTSKNTFTASFVNAEKPQYLVIEDIFPNGRPALEKAGVIFTDRDTVDKVEKMKVCTCLNPLHTALAIFGCLLSYDAVYKEMQDKHLKKLAEIIGYKEGMPVVVDPKIINPKDFLDEVLNVRIPNIFIPDTPQRIATDTSQKLSIRFGETIKAYIKRDDLNLNNLKCIPLVFAGWCRYLMGIDDYGNKYEISKDPMLDNILPYIKNIKVEDENSIKSNLYPILSNNKIFGINLYEINLGQKVESIFKELSIGNGAVRKTLEKYINC